MDTLSESQQEVFDEVEVRVFRHYKEGYVGEINFPDGKESCDLPPLDREALGGITDVRAYGIQLFEWLFREDLLKAFRKTRWSTETYSGTGGPVSGIRLRLWIDRQIGELQCLWWETLRDPSRDEPLSTDVAFSRFLRVQAPRGRPISERPLRMLWVASNPEGLNQFNLRDIDIVHEDEIISRVTTSLGKFLKLDRIVGTTKPAQIWGEVEEGYHIVHVLAHAITIDGRGCLLLANDKGQAEPVPFEMVVAALASSPSVAPYFVFLATPLTAGGQTGEALVSFAPMLIEAGVQAVVAVQSPISHSALRHFTERFYKVLINTGVIDMAMTEARTVIYEPEGWEWAYPVLFLGTPDAQLFHPLPKALQDRLQSFKKAW